MAEQNVVTLDEFIKDAHAQVDAFEAMWLKNHIDEPHAFPMAVEEDNAGIWLEQLLIWWERNSKPGEY